MRPIATDVARSMVCVPVWCLVGIRVSCAELIQMPFSGLTHFGSRHHVLDGV